MYKKSDEELDMKLKVSLTVVILAAVLALITGHGDDVTRILEAAQYLIGCIVLVAIVGIPILLVVTDK